MGNNKRAPDSKVWMAKTISKFQDLVRKIWFERNEQLHNKETSEENKRQNTELNIRIDRIYEKLQEVAPSNRFITSDEKRFFSRRPSTIKNKKVRTKRKWVDDAEVILESYIARTRNGRLMRDYILYHLRDHG